MTKNRSPAVAETLEEWRSVPGAPKYLASSLGRIRGPRGLRKLNAPPSQRGYLGLNISVAGVVRRAAVHVLVCEAFHGLKPTAGHEVAHWDGTKANNCPDNLRWATPAENAKDKVRHGTHAKDNHPRASLSSDDVGEIRRRRSEQPAHYVNRGWRKAIVSEFGITIHALKDILHGRSWVGV